MTPMPSEDITFCTNWNCNRTRCIRNPKHIKQPIPHSFMPLDNTEFCFKSQKTISEQPKSHKIFVLPKDLKIRGQYGSARTITYPAGLIFYTVPGAAPGNIKVKSAEGYFQMELTPEAFKNIFYSNNTEEKEN